MTKKVRLYIKNLPERATEEEIKAKFADYGKVVDVKVQERKNIVNNASSRYFAYVNVKTDDSNLQRCFADFNRNLWHHEQVELQMAKENFLDVLKREREASARVTNGEITAKHVGKTDSEIKRVNSINQMVKGYQLQKAAVKTALASIDFKPNKKIIFDEEIVDSTIVNGTSKPSTSKNLFEDDDDDEPEPNFNFEVQKIFEGKKGKELYELQSKYKNDKRFVLDERFRNDDENEEAMTIQEEKQRQYQILEQVLGGKAKVKEPVQNNKNSMLRFDPTHSEHRKYEITKKTEKQQQNQKTENEETREEDLPKVSKDVFYKVDDLKEALQKEQGFSLLNMFGSSDQNETTENFEEEESAKDIKSNLLVADSSDNEEIEEVEAPSNEAEVVDSSKFWHETFFFSDDDYRFQEGSDFVKRLASENKDEFAEVRKRLKEIVKSKVRNNQQRNKPFKKKLGGAKRKKMIRIKKAMKR